MPVGEPDYQDPGCGRDLKLFRHLKLLVLKQQSFVIFFRLSTLKDTIKSGGSSTGPQENYTVATDRCAFW